MTIAHLSDFHFGQTPKHTAAALALRDAVKAEGIDFVMVTGDITDRGRSADYEQFEAIFGPLRDAGRLFVVPGNHDRQNDNVAARMMSGLRVDGVSRDGMRVIRIDSTGPHNRWGLVSHGIIDRKVIEDVERQVDAAAPNEFIVVMLHHHLLPLPAEGLLEAIAGKIGMPHAAEILLGHTLLGVLRDKAHLILHGHKHNPSELILPNKGRELRIYNAGCSTTLGRFRVFDYENGMMSGEPRWVKTLTHSEK